MMENAERGVGHPGLLIPTLLLGALALMGNLNFLSLFLVSSFSLLNSFPPSQPIMQYFTQKEYFQCPRKVERRIKYELRVPTTDLINKILFQLHFIFCNVREFI